MSTPSVLDQLRKFRYTTTTRDTPWPLIRSLNVAALRVHPPDLQQLSHITSAMSDCRLVEGSSNVDNNNTLKWTQTDVEQLLAVQQALLQFSLHSQSVLKDQLLLKQQTAAVQSVTLQQYTTLTTRLDEAKQRLADAAVEKQSMQTLMHNYEKQIVELKTKCQMLEKESIYFRNAFEKEKEDKKQQPHHQQQHHHGGMIPPPASSPQTAEAAAKVAIVEKKDSASKKRAPSSRRHRYQQDEDTATTLTSDKRSAEEDTSTSTNTSRRGDDYVRSKHNLRKHRSSSGCRHHHHHHKDAHQEGNNNGSLNMVQQFAMMAALIHGRPLDAPSINPQKSAAPTAAVRHETDFATTTQTQVNHDMIVLQLQRELQVHNERMTEKMQVAIQAVELGLEKKIAEANRSLAQKLESDERQWSIAIGGMTQQVSDATKLTAAQIRSLQDEVRLHSESQMTALRQQLATLSLSAPTLSQPAMARSQSPQVLPPLAVLSSPVMQYNNVAGGDNSGFLNENNNQQQQQRQQQQFLSLPTPTSANNILLNGSQLRPKLDVSAISAQAETPIQNTSTTAFGPRVLSASASVVDPDLTSDEDDDPYVPMHEQGALPKIPCEHCRMLLPSNEIQEHQQSCELRMVTCPSCRMSVIARKLATHRCEASPVDMSSSLTRRGSSKMLQDTQDELQRLLEEEARDEARKAAAAAAAGK
jgi:hypothetical protein